MSLQMGQSSQAKLKAPHAVLELGLQNEDTEVGAHTHTKSHLHTNLGA